jgi:dolichol-phosphate mannosyltransferase
MTGPAWIVVPTYNEAANLEPLVHGIREAAPDAHILVVDDDSPDGTGALADAIAARDEHVEVLHRPGKAGLGLAYVNGFAHALRAGAGYVLEMDADLSHDPRDVPRLIAAAEAGADLVLGSRYVAGGGVEDWDTLRRVLSRGGCRYARTMLGVGVRDLTGGFKCFRADTLRAIDFETVRSEGYAFQVELTYRALARGLRVEEVPITFRDRRAGDSKMSARIAMEAIWLVPALRIARRPDGLPEAPGSGEPGALPIPEA